jgi:hypothetical protein
LAVFTSTNHLHEQYLWYSCLMQVQCVRILNPRSKLKKCCHLNATKITTISYQVEICQNDKIAWWNYKHLFRPLVSGINVSTNLACPVGFVNVIVISFPVSAIHHCFEHVLNIEIKDFSAFHYIKTSCRCRLENLQPIAVILAFPILSITIVKPLFHLLLAQFNHSTNFLIITKLNDSSWPAAYIFNHSYSILRSC